MKHLEFPDVEIHELKSEIIGETFEILVKQPDPNVVSLFGDEPLPVIYGTDANISSGGYINTIDSLYLGGEIPPVLFVGIRYKLGDEPDFMQFVTNRTREFTPVEDIENQKLMEQMTLREVKGGGADKFLKFLTTELRDWVSERFNVSDDTTYIGDSMGGLFGIYTLFNKPDSFKRYVIGSPRICWDYPLCFDYEKKYKFPFIIAVKGKNKNEILENFRSRINNDYEKEFQEAKKQVMKIALFRLNEILETN